MFKVISNIIKSLFSKGSINVTNNFSNGQMNLVAYSRYGSKTEKTIYNVTKREIKETILALDWKGFNIVTIERGEGEILGVSGLLEDDGITPPGLTSTWDEAGEMYVIRKAPESVEELIILLTQYLKRDNQLKDLYE